jgi:hypothetical protein
MTVAGGRWIQWLARWRTFSATLCNGAFMLIHEFNKPVPQAGHIHGCAVHPV